MPGTRYQGSKRKLADWIWSRIRALEFHTALDAFGGTGSVAYMLKQQGKAVTYNDILQFNHRVGQALIANRGRTLAPDRIELLATRAPHDAYPDFVEKTFSGIYYTDEENRWLDTVCHNIQGLHDPYHRALAYHAVGQAALAKRPYNLFHRRNLYMRTADVRRGFGNKTTWDRPFPELFRRFALEANRAVFDNGQPCTALCGDALDVEPGFDLVYIDPPYINARGIGVDYHGFYHFLEGLLDYDGWADRIDRRSKHLRMIPQDSPWTRRDQIGAAFRAVFERFASSHLVVSYRSDGIPSPEELAQWLGEVKSQVRLNYYGNHKYALSTNNRSQEILLVGTSAGVRLPE